MIRSGSKPDVTFAFQAFRQSRLNLSEVSGLSDIEHSRSKASGNSPFLAGCHSIRAVAHERGEALDGEHPLRVALKRANLTADALGLRREAMVEKDGALDMGEGALAPMKHVSHHAPSCLPRRASACSSNSSARTIRPSISSLVASGRKSRSMLAGMRSMPSLCFLRLRGSWRETLPFAYRPFVDVAATKYLHSAMSGIIEQKTSPTREFH